MTKPPRLPRSSRRPREGAADATPTYEVGYCKPPVDTRFQSGRSGNPRGRPKRQRNLRNVFERELDKPIVVREGDRTRTVTKRDALVTVLVNNTVKGDIKAWGAFLGVLRALRLVEEAPEPDQRAPLTAEDSAIIHDFYDRYTPEVPPDSDAAPRRENAEADAKAAGKPTTKRRGRP